MANSKIQLTLDNQYVEEWLKARCAKTGATQQGAIRAILYEAMLAAKASSGRSLADRVWIHEKEST